MKLIIDIPVISYKWVKTVMNREGAVLFDEIYQAVNNCIPLEEELEKIKAEIIENQYITCGLTCIPYGDCKYYDCIEVKEVIECLELIEKHIKELKGEQEWH